MIKLCPLNHPCSYVGDPEFSKNNTKWGKEHKPLTTIVCGLLQGCNYMDLQKDHFFFHFLSDLKTKFISVALKPQAVGGSH